MFKVKVAIDSRLVEATFASEMVLLAILIMVAVWKVVLHEIPYPQCPQHQGGSDGLSLKPSVPQDPKSRPQF